MNKGDYVLATKYKDGMSEDHFVVGYYQGTTPNGRHIVSNEHGELFRGNGFRRAQIISKEAGKKIIQNMERIERSGKSVWSFFSQFEKIQTENITN